MPNVKGTVQVKEARNQGVEIGKSIYFEVSKTSGTQITSGRVRTTNVISTNTSTTVKITRNR